MKRFSVLTVFIALLVLPSMLFAASKMAVGEATVSNSTVTIPVNVTNQDGLMALDIPLKFSEGVTLKEVTFDNTRSDYFDLKVADIDNENHTVAIGLITQIAAAPRPDLAAGDGAVANLVFEVTDPNITAINLESVSMSKPDHDLMFIYHEYQDGNVVGQDVEQGKFDPVSVALSTSPNGPNVPTQFALNQNYPNPFNPSTVISLDIPTPTNYRMDIYNVLGQVVKTFEGFGEAGRVEVTWDASNNSSGVYFYRVTAGDFTATRKMMLLK